MDSIARKPLPDVYHDWLASTVDEDGFEIPHGMLIAPDGSMTLAALAVPPTEAYRFMLAQFERLQASEAIFALDRFARPGQGTVLGDLMAGWHLQRAARPRPFIVEYRYEPRLIQPINWANPLWNAALTGELLSALRAHTGLRLDVPLPAGAD